MLSPCTMLFVDPAVERDYCVSHFQSLLYETLAIGVVTLLVALIRHVVSSANGIVGVLFAAFFDSSLLFLSLAIVVTAVCWAVLRAAPHPQSLEDGVLQEMALVTQQHTTPRNTPASAQQNAATSFPHGWFPLRRGSIMRSPQGACLCCGASCSFGRRSASKSRSSIRACCTPLTRLQSCVNHTHWAPSPCCPCCTPS